MVRDELNSAYAKDLQSVPSVPSVPHKKDSAQGIPTVVFESLPEPYITILNYKGGPEALEIYKKLHPKALFRD